MYLYTRTIIFFPVIVFILLSLHFWYFYEDFFKNTIIKLLQSIFICTMLLIISIL